MRAALFALALLFSSPETPLSRIDRMKTVGAPVISDETANGVYVWLEDGWFNVSAVHRTNGKKSITVEVRSTKKLDHAEGDFHARARASSLMLSAVVGGAPVRGRFQTAGEVTVVTTEPLFVGPLSRRAQSPLSIGRY